MTAQFPRRLATPEQFAQAGLAGRGDAPALAKVAQSHALGLTPALAALIDRTDPADPIARQFLPDAAELTILPDESADPISDRAHSPVPGIVHRHADRVLLKATGACDVYCRFCFRREMVGPGAGGALAGAKLDAALAYVAARPEIFEVIVTGGDPFSLSARRVAELTGRLDAIDHVRAIRWHTRGPVAAPAKIDAAFARALRSAKDKAVYVAVHANHARELTIEARAACARLIEVGGAALVSQSVLLRGVNDSIEALEDLMRAFLAARIKPYYLHHLDQAPGTSHFRVPMAEGRELMRGLRRRLSGLAMPTYVIDLPGGRGKVPVGPVYLDGDRAEDLFGAVASLQRG